MNDQTTRDLQRHVGRARVNSLAASVYPMCERCGHRENGLRRATPRMFSRMSGPLLCRKCRGEQR